MNSETQLKRLLNALLEISYYVGSVMELDEILEKITEITVNVMNADISSVYLYSEETNELVLRATTGLPRELVNKSRFMNGEGIPGWVFVNNQLVNLLNAHKDPRYAPLPGADEKNFMAYLCFPLRIQDKVIGCMTVRDKYEYEFTEEEITTFETICKQVAIVIEKAQLYYGKIKMERLAAMTLSLSGVAHYIKNILQGMSGGIYFVDVGLEKNDLERVKQGWVVLKKTSRKMTYLVENMLNFSRSSKSIFERDKITNVTAYLVDYIRETLKERNIKLLYEPDMNLPDSYIDFSGMFDAMLNIVGNSLDAIPTQNEGTLKIRTYLDTQNNHVVCEIGDNGAGIPPDILPKIFDLFFTTKGTSGTGLGLAVTKKIIDEHFGKIEVSTKIGEGTTFRILLPVAEDVELKVQTSQAFSPSLQS